MRPSMEPLPPTPRPDGPAPGPEPVPPDADPSEEKYRGWPYVDRRVTPDRRARPTRWWESLLGARRRQAGRRSDELHGIYVDQYERRDLALVGGIFLLNLFDAALTLYNLSQGIGEANPVMAAVLDLGPYAFVYEKCFVVGSCLVALVVHKNFGGVRRAMLALLWAYALLALYHLVLHW